ncbi:hypothetical protein KFL_002120090 [Klebsormidium nitens]|uniref:Nucleolar 27S pre-rRNA processing Urb2/Npa2 C-terminal domain-containing protein n=1 Tax=Klebsormidium nitens TaxID=105231 RepID=A0A1Y1I1W6_KLENI|nr:hypothetical protein KFL_002120090 [Klebsormidium nitens]|eukprot:GAQ84915.1 hypothetical protein KFL_002120090 [Klebsormidium nitens]
MSSLAVVRALQSKDLELDRKVEIAWGARCLVEQIFSEADAPSVGLIGHVHLLRYLFQWTLSTLTRTLEGAKPSKQATQPGGTSAERDKTSTAASQSGTKKQKSTVHVVDVSQIVKSSAQATLGEGASHVLDLRLWEVLRACLLSGKLGSDAPINAALLQAVSAVLSLKGPEYSAPREVQAAADLDVVISAILTVLSTRFARSFRPSLEQWAAATEVALKHPLLSCTSSPILGSPPGGQTILLILHGLNAACRAHANPRKVFTLQVDRLLTPVLTARFSLQGAIWERITSGHGPSTEAIILENGSGKWKGGWAEEMLRVLESILEGGLFHGAHVAGYSEVCPSLEDSRQTDGAAETGEDADGRDGEEGGSRKKKRRTAEMETGDEGAKAKLASYHRLLFQALEVGVNERDQAVIGSLDWFLRAYVEAGKREQKDDPGRNSSAEEGAGLLTEVNPEEGAPPKTATSEGGKKKRVPGSEATFRVFAELMRPLLQQLEAGVRNAEVLLGSIRGCRLLLAAANEVHAYIPTEDTPSRAHYRFLDRAKAAVFDIAHAPSSSSPIVQADPLRFAAASAPRILPAPLAGQILGFLLVLLETEYRVLDGDLVRLWSLLLQAAEMGAERLSEGVPVPNGRSSELVNGWLAAKAVRLGSRLLEVYGDLRQGEHVLATLTEALCAYSSGGPSLLVCSAPFLTALSRLVQKLPMGQAAPVLRMLARDQGTLLEGLGSGSGCQSLPALTELHVSILDNIHVTEGNAVAIGSAARQLLHSAVAPNLGPKLHAWAQSGSEAATTAAILGDIEITSRKKAKRERSNGVEPNQGRRKSEEGFEQPEDAMLLRLFLSAWSLHEHAVGLMPPAAATKASAALLSLEASRNSDRGETLADESAGHPSSEGERSIFAAIGCGHVRLGTVTRSLGGRSVAPSLRYALDCTVLHELERLSRVVRRLEVGLADARSGELLGSLPSELESLLRFLLSVQQSDQEKSREDVILDPHASPLGPKQSEKKRKATPSSSTPAAAPPLNGSESTPATSDGWDGVVSKLTDRSYPAAKWRLVCQSVDLWAPLAGPADCTAFLERVLETIENGRGEPSAGVSQAEPETLPVQGTAGLEKSSLEKLIAGEVRQEVALAEPVRVCTVQASTLELLREAAFFEQAAFQAQLPHLVLDELWACASAATAQIRSRKQGPDSCSAEKTALTSLGSSKRGQRRDEWGGREVFGSAATRGGSEDEREELPALERCNALLKFLSRLGSGFLLPGDVGRSLDVLLRIERCLLSVAQSASPTPSERLALLASIALSRATFARILASNPASLFQLPHPSVSNSGPSKTAAASKDPAVPSLTNTFENSKKGSETLGIGTRWGKEEVEGFLKTVEDCARAGVDASSLSVASVIVSTKGSVHTLASSALEAAGFAPLRMGTGDLGPTIGPALERGTTTNQVRSGQSADPEQLGSGFLESAFEAVSRQTKQANLFLVAEQTEGASLRRRPRPESGPASLLPRTLLLAAKQRGTSQGTAQQAADGVDGRGERASLIEEKQRGDDGVQAASRNGSEGPQRTGDHAVGWAEAAIAAAGAGALLKAVEEVMEQREQACRVEREAEMTWHAPDATWQAAIDRLESGVVECLSKLIGGQDPAAGVVEGGLGVTLTGEKGKGRRVLRGSLEGLEYIFAEGNDENGRVSEVEGGLRSRTVAGGDETCRAFSDELLTDTGAVAELKRIVVGELFAAVGSVVRIRSLLVSTHVRKLSPGNETTAQLGSSPAEGAEKGLKEGGKTLDVVERKGTDKGSKRKKRKGGETDGSGVVDDSPSEHGRNGDEATEPGSRKKKRRVSQEAGEVEDREVNPPAVLDSAVSGPSPALATLGRHLAAASDVVTSFLQRASHVSASRGSGTLQRPEITVESAQMLAHVVDFLEAAGGCFPLLYPAPPIAAFDWLVETHLALFGVSATSTSRLPSRPQTGGLEAALSAVRSRAEASFGTLIRGASRQQLLRMFQAVEKDMANGDGGPRTEAAVGALAVVLESVSGPKSLRLLASHAPRLLSVLFSVIGSAAGHGEPWAARSGGLLTSALQVLTTFVSREVLFPLTAAQVGLALSVPATLFSASQALTRGSQTLPLPTAPTSVPLPTPAPPSKSSFEGTAQVAPIGASSAPGANVAAGECATLCSASRLLQAVLRHRPKEVRRCAALLVGSLQAMLQAIAAWSQDAVRQEAAGTACAALRRVYEEVGNHKASLSHYCVHMLADYLAALCGLTASKDAISRDAATTLRSGIFALFDSCSPYDLQQLHASLGADATRRNALAALRQDYEKRHKYTGKV